MTKTQHLLLSVLILTWAVPLCPAAESPAPRPNILWITCEDISPVLGCYGDRLAVTPNLDRLAAEGVRYTNAFSTASVCSPSRSTLITGVYASSLGTQNLRSTILLPAAVRCFPEYLREAGYYCTNNVKEDYNFKTPAACWDESSRNAHWRNRKPGQPFFAVFNITTTHQGQIRLADPQFAKRTARLTADERHDPAAMRLPPYYPDTPVVRRDVAHFYDLVTAMDKQVGDLLAALDKDGLADETIVFFYSDHGTGLPRHKRWIYDSGTRVPLLIRFPKKLRRLAPGEPGSATDRLVSFVDFAPTVLSLAGLEIPGTMEGRAFLGAEAGPPREYVFSIRDRVDEVFEMSRTVRDARYRYIRNFMPHRPVMQHSTFSEQTPTRQEFRRLSAENKLTGPAARMVSPTKPAEELYDTHADPWEVVNLADSPEHQETLRRLRGALRQWMLDTRDTGLLPEPEMYLRGGPIPPYDLVRREGYPLERILDTADLVGRGSGAIGELTTRLGDPDSAVRYWAATGLAALGAEAKPAEKALVAALDDPSPCVRIPAVEALVNLGRREQAVPVLLAALRDKNGWVRLQSASTLAHLGPQAGDVAAELQNALDDKHPPEAAMFIRWALAYAIDELQPAKQE